MFPSAKNLFESLVGTPSKAEAECKANSPPPAPKPTVPPPAPKPAVPPLVAKPADKPSNPVAGAVKRPHVKTGETPVKERKVFRSVVTQTSYPHGYTAAELDGEKERWKNILMEEKERVRKLRENLRGVNLQKIELEEVVEKLKKEEKKTLKAFETERDTFLKDIAEQIRQMKLNYESQIQKLKTGDKNFEMAERVSALTADLMTVSKERDRLKTIIEKVKKDSSAQQPKLVRVTNDGYASPEAMIAADFSLRDPTSGKRMCKFYLARNGTPPACPGGWTNSRESPCGCAQPPNPRPRKDGRPAPVFAHVLPKGWPGIRQVIDMYRRTGGTEDYAMHYGTVKV